MNTSSSQDDFFPEKYSAPNFTTDMYDFVDNRLDYYSDYFVSNDLEANQNNDLITNNPVKKSSEPACTDNINDFVEDPLDFYINYLNENNLECISNNDLATNSSINSCTPEIFPVSSENSSSESMVKEQTLADDEIWQNTNEFIRKF
ncbi:uncharacterized protein LOC126837990 isoform X2 [Adelges cooleyi]|uniref:uncharacterized protein LOC126837990 isoform X2 n=1 Tax=Adelges cooleyi TaxID=133065 RepID=UPI00217FAC5E|nr:uncharacterized protein LOC126837990 isoform X2 [Adelges cooleyi]